MTENKKIRLSGVAREYNVGINTIVEFLEKKGVAIERSPSTFVEGNALDMIRSEFGKDKMEKVNIREKIRSEQQSVSLDDKNRETDKQEQAPEKEIIVKSPSIFNLPVENLTGPKVLGKMDLSPKKEQKTENKTESSKEVKEEVVVEPTPKVNAEHKAVAAVAPSVGAQAKPEVGAQAKPEVGAQAKPETAQQAKSEVGAQAKPEVGAQAKSEVGAQAKSEVGAQAKPEVGAQAKPEVGAQAKSEVGAQAKPEVGAQAKPEVGAQAKPEMEKQVSPGVDTPKVEQKQQEATPVKLEKPVAKPNELFRANEPEKLAGPTVLGKMELPVARPSKSSEDKRGKRNRIKKNKVDLAAPGQAGQGQIPGRISGATTPPGARPNQGNRPNTGAGVGNSRFSNQGGGGRGKNTPRPVVKTEVSEEDVQKQIKETLARLTSKGIKGKGAKYRRDKRDAVGQRMAEEAELQEQRSSTLQVTEFVTVSELATMMDVAVTEVITACMNLGLMVSINQRLDAEALVIVAEEFGFKVEFVAVDIQEAIDTEVDTEEDMETRSPIVTVMGHVDHGKTSLLDYIRKANVIDGEAGGITQHIGAYSVKMDDGRRITFLDTPGHEAFTAMRARGAKVTDVAIIIAAADDAIMPQTIEAINHATAAGVPIIFAINKIDKPAANPEKIKEQLANMNYLVEDWGGKYQSQDIAAKTGLNVDKLLEKIILEADLLDLKANPNRKATGSVIESTLDKGRGFVTTILVQNGTLRVGDVILSGIYTGRVKAMFNERGHKIKEATPSTPVLVLGLNGAPQAGDSFNVMDDDKQARDIANKRDQLQRMQGLRTQKHITLDEIGRRIAIGSFKELNIIVKGDVDGSIEALTDSLLKLSKEEVQVNVIHKAVGQISESDILLAAASNAIVVGFQVRPSAAARRLAEKEEIDVRLYSIIYDAINEVKDAIVGMLAPITKEEITCSVEVLETFKITKVGTVAGCMVREGKITRNTTIRVIRDGIVVYTGRLGSLKRFKDDVKEVNSGYDCGLNIDGFNDIKVGDFVEGYEQVEVARKHS